MLDAATVKAILVNSQSYMFNYSGLSPNVMKNLSSVQPLTNSTFTHYVIYTQAEIMGLLLALIFFVSFAGGRRPWR